MVAFSELGDFLDHLALLVHLDRIHAAVLASVFRDLDRLAESLVDLGDAGVEKVAETEQNGEVRAAIAQTFDDVVEGNIGLSKFVSELDGHVAIFVDAKETMPPSVDPIELCRFLGSPGWAGLGLRKLGGKSCGRRNHARNLHGAAEVSMGFRREIRRYRSCRT